MGFLCWIEQVGRLEITHGFYVPPGSATAAPMLCG